MTEPDVESYCSAFALIEATAEERTQDAKLIISEASMDTMLALARITTAVLLQTQQINGVSPTEVTRNLRAKLLSKAVS